MLFDGLSFTLSDIEIMIVFCFLGFVRVGDSGGCRCWRMNRRISLHGTFLLCLKTGTDCLQMMSEKAEL